MGKLRKPETLGELVHRLPATHHARINKEGDLVVYREDGNEDEYVGVYSLMEFLRSVNLIKLSAYKVGPWGAKDPPPAVRGK